MPNDQNRRFFVVVAWSAAIIPFGLLISFIAIAFVKYDVSLVLLLAIALAAAAIPLTVVYIRPRGRAGRR